MHYSLHIVPFLFTLVALLQQDQLAEVAVIPREKDHGLMNFLRLQLTVLAAALVNPPLVSLILTKILYVLQMTRLQKAIDNYMTDVPPPVLLVLTTLDKKKGKRNHKNIRIIVMKLLQRKGRNG